MEGSIFETTFKIEFHKITNLAITKKNKGVISVNYGVL